MLGLLTVRIIYLILQYNARNRTQEESNWKLCGWKKIAPLIRWNSEQVSHWLGIEEILDLALDWIFIEEWMTQSWLNQETGILIQFNRGCCVID